jgi:restriction system protein
MAPDAFEPLAGRLLREAGFDNVVVTGQTNVGGIDGRGILRVGLVSFPLIFQCKRYHGSVGSKAVRDFRGAMAAGRVDKGLLTTTGTFTAERGSPGLTLQPGTDTSRASSEGRRSQAAHGTARADRI